jgi:F420-non-reducing hydrogenase iron-sulfur subunit
MKPLLEHDFEPEITAFYCIYCGYMAADTAGALRVDYPANVKFVRLPCTGKTDVRYILDAFEHGADGVYVIACPIGNCHHVRGNERGRARIERTKVILDEIGLGADRLDMFFVSGSQAMAFARAAKVMTERVRNLGPNPLRTNGPVLPGGKWDEDPNSNQLGWRGRPPVEKVD